MSIFELVAQPLGEDVVAELGHLEDLGVGLEGHLRAPALRLSHKPVRTNSRR